MLSPNLFKEQWHHKSLLTHCALKTDFDECRGFSCSAGGVTALHILLFWLLIYPLKWKNASSVKKQDVQHMNAILWRKNQVVICKITSQLVAKRAEGRQWNSAEWLGKCLKFPLQRRGSFIYSFFIVYKSLIFWLHLMRYVLYMIKTKWTKHILNLDLCLYSSDKENNVEKSQSFISIVISA